MAKIRMRHRDPEKANTGIKFIHAEKGQKLKKRLLIYKILLLLSFLGNLVLIYIKH